jgi:hypothetical protein
VKIAMQIEDAETKKVRRCLQCVRSNGANQIFTQIEGGEFSETLTLLMGAVRPNVL